MVDLKNDEVVNAINRILDDPADTIRADMFRDLIGKLDECKVLCPVRDGQIVTLNWMFQTHIPASCDMDDFKVLFEDNEPEIFEFKQLNDFRNGEVDSIMLNPGGRTLFLNKFLSDIVFNQNRSKKPTSKGYDVKVRLNDFRPLTWRDLIIPDNITFTELDDIMKTLWGFNGYHLSCFLIRKDKLMVTDEDLARETMMGCDYEANTTLISEVFDKYDKITYWYDFGDDWQFDIEIKKKIDYDKDYVTIKRFKGKYNPIEDCKGVYGLSEVVYYAENPDEADSSYFCELVEYLEEFDMDFSQLALESKAYTRSNWHRDVYFQK